MEKMVKDFIQDAEWPDHINRLENSADYFEKEALTYLKASACKEDAMIRITKMGNCLAQIYENLIKVKIRNLETR